MGFKFHLGLPGLICIVICNLRSYPSDVFLCDRMDDQGYVFVTVIATFNRIQAFHQPIEVIIDAMQVYNTLLVV